MALKGKAHVYGDDINTDYIIAGKYRSICLDMKDMAKHVMEDLDADFVNRVRQGDFIIGGKNFGCGSSREYAPKVVLEAGITAIFAESFGRTFYRNGINSGLPLLECDTSSFSMGDELEADIETGVIRNITKGATVTFTKMPPFMTAIIAEGGMVGYLKKHKVLDMLQFR